MTDVQHLALWKVWKSILKFPHENFKLFDMHINLAEGHANLWYLPLSAHCRKKCKLSTDKHFVWNQFDICLFYQACRMQLHKYEKAMNGNVVSKR